MWISLCNAGSFQRWKPLIANTEKLISSILGTVGVKSGVLYSAATATERKLQAPHGGKLVDLMAEGSEKEQAVAACTKQLELSDRNACDVELLCVG